MRASLLVLAALLAGCTPRGVLVQNLAQVPKDKGIVLFSTGASQKSLSFHTAVAIVEADTRRQRSLPHFINASLLRSHFPDEYGHVGTVVLPPGTYYLAPRAGNNLYRCIGSRVQYRFEVRGGEVTYLGNFHLDDQALLHSPTAKMARDLEYFRQRNPSLASAEIRPQAVEASRDEKGEC